MSGKKRVRHNPGEIVQKLHEADRLLNAGQSLGQVLQALEISQQTSPLASAPACPAIESTINQPTLIAAGT